MYELMFRQLCYNPEVDNNWSLRANVQSINSGLKRWYGGRENLPLAYLLHTYIGRGKLNHQITFSEFIFLIRDLSLSRTHVNLLVFQMITEGQRELSVLQLLRQYVCTPKGCVFARELYKLIEYYMQKYLDVAPIGGGRLQMRDIIYTIDFDTFRDLIPYSRLATELVNKFIKMPEQAFDPDTNLFKESYFEDLTREEEQKRQESCLVSSDPDEMDPNKTQVWRQSRHMWNKMRGS